MSIVQHSKRMEYEDQALKYANQAGSLSMGVETRQIYAQLSTTYATLALMAEHVERRALVATGE